MGHTSYFRACTQADSVRCLQPLFLYVPFQSVHSANSYKHLEAPYEYVKKMAHIKHEGRRTFAGRCNS